MATFGTFSSSWTLTSSSFSSSLATGSGSCFSSSDYFDLKHRRHYLAVARNLSAFQVLAGEEDDWPPFHFIFVHLYAHTNSLKLVELKIRQPVFAVYQEVSLENGCHHSKRHVSQRFVL